MENEVEQCLQVINAQIAEFNPHIAVVLGSGLGAFADEVAITCDIDYADLPGFPSPGVSGHAGSLRLGHIGSTAVALLMGRAHYYEDGKADVMRVPLEVIHRLGCQSVLLTNAAGSLLHAPPGSIMMLKDHLNFTGASPLFGVHTDDCFVDMSEVYDVGLRAQMADIAREQEITLYQGVYAWMSGPQFETPAEIKALRLMGADAVGMSTVPEAIIARFLGMRVAGLSIITNFAAGMLSTPLSHKQTIENAAKAADDVRILLTDFISRA